MIGGMENLMESEDDSQPTTSNYKYHITSQQVRVAIESILGDVNVMQD